MTRAYTIGRLLITTCRQAAGAPWIDPAMGKCNGGRHDGRGWHGRAILLTPWRRNEHGDRPPQTALCIGLLDRKKRAPQDVGGQGRGGPANGATP